VLLTPAAKCRQPGARVSCPLTQSERSKRAGCPRASFAGAKYPARQKGRGGAPPATEGAAICRLDTALNFRDINIVHYG